MRRAIPLIVVLLLAVGVAAWLSAGGDPTGLATAVAVEKRLRAGDVAGAHAEIRATRGRVPAWRTDSMEALALFAADRTDEAGAAAERAYAAGPDATDDWRVVSIVFHTRIRAKRPGEAWAVLDRYLAAHPDDERALASAAQYWTGLAPGGDDAERAAGYLDRIDRLAARAAPPEDPTALTETRLESLRAVVAALRGRFREALIAARDAVARAPGNAEAHARLADFLRRSGDVAGAAAEAREAVRLAPSEPLYLEQLAMILLELDGGGREALEAALRLAEARPGDPGPRILEARALVRLDRIPEAIDLYRSLLATDLPAERRKEVLRNLGAALYDWKQGGLEGPYLDEAHALLAEYVRLGGTIDERLADTWAILQERARTKGAETPR